MLRGYHAEKDQGRTTVVVRARRTLFVIDAIFSCLIAIQM